MGERPCEGFPTKVSRGQQTWEGCSAPHDQVNPIVKSRPFTRLGKSRKPDSRRELWGPPPGHGRGWAQMRGKRVGGTWRHGGVCALWSRIEHAS